MKKALLITFISKYSNIIISFFLTMVLARLLTPSVFGIVAIVSIFISFFGLIGDMGIGPAIIQYKKLSDEDVNSIFKFTLIIAIILSLSFFFFSFFVGWFYQSHIYSTVCKWMSIGILFMTSSIVPINLLYRDKKFLLAGVSSVVSNVCGGVAAIYFAYIGYGVYSLIINMITQSLLNFIICLILSKMKIFKRGFDWEPVKKISSFSIYQFLFNFVNYFTRNFDNLIVGKLLGTNMLGYYDRAYRTMMYPMQGLTFVISPVLQPILSDYIDDKEKIYKKYLKATQALSLIGALIVPLCFFNAKEIIYILFGNQWSASILPFKWLSLSIGIQLVLSTIGAIFQATENTKYMFQTGLISSITFVVLSLGGLIIGKSIIWLSAFLTFGFLVNFIQNYYVLITKIFKKSFISFLSQFKIAVFITLLLFIENIIIPINLTNYFVSLISKSIMIVISYIGLCVLMGKWKLIKNYIKY